MRSRRDGTGAAPARTGRFAADGYRDARRAGRDRVGAYGGGTLARPQDRADLRVSTSQGRRQRRDSRQYAIAEQAVPPGGTGRRVADGSRSMSAPLRKLRGGGAPRCAGSLILCGFHVFQPGFFTRVTAEFANSAPRSEERRVG